MKKSHDKKNQNLSNEKKSVSKISKHENGTTFNLQLKNKSKNWFYIILILIPILFFVLLEFSLRIFNYGYDQSQWIEIGNDKLVINPDYGKRYFNNINFTPQTSDDYFDKNKKSNSFRVFVLGASSAAGFPYMPMGAFSKYIQKRLELVYPTITIEVINISMTAVNSYTLLDLIPGVLDQNPDLIIIYAGHNEYYGALGVGSVESLGSSGFLKKMILNLNNYKITQLVKNLISGILSIFAKKESLEKSHTLMSKMAQEKSIQLNSEMFNHGAEQFSNNLTEILEKVKNKNIPIILGRLVSNYKDQKPFESFKGENQKSADEIFQEAQTEYKNSNFTKADSLFILAKDLDALRFRAPEKFNQIINSLANKFNVAVAKIDSLFIENSPHKIIGNNLMVDHLHPNVEGYLLIGKAFYETMEKHNYLPQNKNSQIHFAKQDSATRANFVFTKLDSIIGNNIVELLKNDWPFTKIKTAKSNEQILAPKNYIDSISFQYIENKISFADAYLKAATLNLQRDNIKEYLKYMNILIYKYPGLKDIKTAIKYFYEQRKVNPQDYTNKRLGKISILTNEYDKAIQYFNESLKQNPLDDEVLYNLALAYTQNKNYRLAKDFIKKCLAINPINSDCLKLKNSLITN
ncbi:MAG: hypothetical protein IPM32_04945 [Ignavibacteriae bacterium]|nr:hypothetical protein [Ignavibacteriota bacterium]